MLAMHQYHTACDRFPPAFVVGPDGKRRHGWLAWILPFLQPKLPEQYRLDEPFISNPNRRVSRLFCKFEYQEGTK